MNSFVKFVKKEIVLLISVLLAVTTSILGKTSPKMLVGAIDWRVISLLFSLMLVIQAFRSVNILDKIADFFINKCNRKSAGKCSCTQHRNNNHCNIKPTPL